MRPNRSPVPVLLEFVSEFAVFLPDPVIAFLKKIIRDFGDVDLLNPFGYRVWRGDHFASSIQTQIKIDVSSMNRLDIQRVQILCDTSANFRGLHVESQ